MKIGTFGSLTPSKLDLEEHKHFTPSLKSLNNDIHENSNDSACNSINSMHHLSPAIDFQKSLETEKSFKYVVDELEKTMSDSPHWKKTKKSVLKIENNYSLQIETLLQEVNRLKLEKQIVENRLKLADTSFGRFPRPEHKRNASESDKLIIEAKNTTIDELMFQIRQLQEENSELKIMNVFQKSELDKSAEEELESRQLRTQLANNQSQIELLTHKLDLKELAHKKLMQKLNLLEHENSNLKLKSQENSCVGDASTQLQSPDASFRSVLETMKPNQITARTQSEQGKFDHNSYLSSVRSKSTFGMESSVSSTPSSLAILLEYERSLLKERENNPQNAMKIVNRLLEVKKLKRCFLEQENKRLQSLLKEKSSARNRQHS